MVAVRFRDGRFDGVFVDDHQAIFGLWDLARSPARAPARPAPPPRLCAGVGGATSDGRTAFAGYLADLRIFDGALGRAELEALGRARPSWRLPTSPGLVHLTMQDVDATAGLVLDAWRIPSATPFRLSGDGAHRPRPIVFEGRQVLRLRAPWRAYLESLNAGPDAQPLDHFVMTLTCRIEALPPEGAAWGLLSRGAGDNGNTSFGIYVGADGRLCAHVKSSSNFSKSFASRPGVLGAGQWHTITFTLDRSDGTLSLGVDGRTVARHGIAHDDAPAQSLRFRNLPLRIGYARVQADSYAPCYPEPSECYFDGMIGEFRIEPYDGQDE